MIVQDEGVFYGRSRASTLRLLFTILHSASTLAAILIRLENFTIRTDMVLSRLSVGGAGNSAALVNRFG